MARSSRNALKHGLAVKLTPDPRASEEVSRLAEAIAGEARGDDTILALARAVAEAELDLIRLREARIALLSLLSADPMTGNKRRKGTQVGDGAKLLVSLPNRHRRAGPSRCLSGPTRNYQKPSWIRCLARL